MWNFDYSNKAEIKRMLDSNGLGMTKKFGQNFLTNSQALDKIVSLCGDVKNKKIWEVGPGFGALTSHLLKAGARVTAFEIDHGFCRVLKEQAFSDEENFTLIEGDALKTWKEEYDKNGRPDIICANLPYNIGSVLIASFIENRCLSDRMVFTLQSEVVQRICSTLADGQYSGFSILTNTDYENKNALRISASNFYPAPNVDSSVVVMTKREKSQVDESIAQNYFKLVRIIFSQRRKTVRNNLKTAGFAGVDSALQQCGIDVNERAEKLTVDQIVGLTKVIF